MKMRSLMIAVLCSTLVFSSCKKDGAVTTGSTTNETIAVVPQSAVPAVIVTSFNNSFAGATEVEWHKSNNHFEVEFNHQNQRHHSGFDDSGHQDSHSISCSSGAVPAAVLDAFRARYPNDNVYEWKLKNDGSWQAHFNRNNVKWEALFNATGTFIKEEHD
jgi:hypothetical protein